ncbi:unnamed protein product [Rotaria sp. Silwood1]|nr:unnamed protein product [Rotaria sp. Silwood1]CAF3759413.1 unnamed protein product [Rotaria sp. Silwood1]CAF4769739.1 unnamed protein product [Rotaria sp. Silwood1]CAF4783653.1 unnamed protein product [Rotaria sp. Silwood1]CAF4819082.1 unnamed protein product [Rotaria sp. Silwood1]
MSSSSTFETLPDEILMIIIRYTGNAYTIFRIFSGLNQRLSNILADKRLHLFTDFLYPSIGNADVNDYYDSNSFCEISQQFASLTTIDHDKQLHQYIQSLVSSYIEEKYKRSGVRCQSGIKQFQIIRKHLTDVEISNLDNELKETFNELRSTLCSVCAYCKEEPRFNSKSVMTMKRIGFLVLTKGARLECHDDDSHEFNFANAV